MTDLVAPALDALEAVLAAAPSVQAVLGVPARLYDQRPVMATFPFAVIDGVEARDASAKGLQATQLVLQLQVFSRQRSGQEVRHILAVLRDVLQDISVTLSSGAIVRCQEELAHTASDADSNGTRGLARYRLLVSG